MSKLKWLLTVAIVAAVAGGGFLAWRSLKPKGMPDGIGRIEAVEIDVAAQVAGRITDILAREGDFVTAGQVLANMNLTCSGRDGRKPRRNRNGVNQHRDRPEHRLACH